MEIVLKRIAKKGTYTIGRLYLLTDSSVNRNSLPGKKKDKKVTILESDLEKYPGMWLKANSSEQDKEKGILRAAFAPYPKEMATTLGDT